MEERQGAGRHRLEIEDRKSGSFTGISDIVSFDTNEILMQTELGRLMVKGRELHVKRLDLSKREVDIEGEVEQLQYTGTAAKKTESLISKMFG